MAEVHFSEPDFNKWERFYRANFFNSIGGFKSLNLIGTKSASGIENLAVFFSVVHLGANPPLLGLVFRPHTVPRHTLENIRESKSLTVNSVNKAMYKQAHQCSASYGQAVSEFVEVNLTPFYSDTCFAPFVQESSVKIACTYVEDYLIEANKTIFMVAKIDEVFVEDTILQKDGLIDLAAGQGVAVNALDAYYQPTLLERLAYARPNEPLKNLDE